jgi:hypothetical protein
MAVPFKPRGDLRRRGLAKIVDGLGRPVANALSTPEVKGIMVQVLTMGHLIRSCCIPLVSLLTVACDPFDTKREHPADAKLIEAFQKNEAVFNELVQMSNGDSNVIRIAHDFTRLETNWAWPRPNSLLGFSNERWDQYRALFKKANLSSGLERTTNATSTAIFFFASSKGMTFRGSSKGYAYSQEALSPLLESLDQHPFDPQNPQKHGVAFKRIKEHWYLFYDW